MPISGWLSVVRIVSDWIGGYVDPGEDIDKAAVREVMEETGIQTKFRSIVAFT